MTIENPASCLAQLLTFIILCKKIQESHCAKSIRIRSNSDPYFPAFRLNTKRHGVSIRIQSKRGKIRTRIIPNTETFYAVSDLTENMLLRRTLFFT